MDTKMAVAFANSFIGENRKANPKRKRSQTTSSETLYWRHNLPLAHQQRCRRKCSLSKQINTIQQSNYRVRYHVRMWPFLDTSICKGQRFIKETVVEYEDAFQTNGDIPVHVLYKCHPPGAKKDRVKGLSLLCKRPFFACKRHFFACSKAPCNELFKQKIWRKHYHI